MKYLALLRGINVGGNNLIKKEELKACFVAAGLESVLTYIQSGNVLFKSVEKDKQKLAKKIQNELKKFLKNDIQLVIFDEAQYSKMLEACHSGWGENPEQKHNALFFLEDIPKAKDLFPKIDLHYEEVTFAEGVIFWSGSKEHYNKTSYTKELVKSPIYKKVTIRNSNTSLKLKDLFDKI